MRLSLRGAGVVCALIAGLLPVSAATASAAAEPLPLARHFDNTAVSDDARPSGADFDGAGASLSAQDLAAAGWRPGRRPGWSTASTRAIPNSSTS
ncbi:SGNH/GDSL hydrolase family protein, partial [Streptomyces sp. NPDC003832]